MPVQLSADALRILNFFKDKKAGVGDYQYPADLENLFPGALEACEAAEEELYSQGLIDMTSSPPDPMRSKVKAAALTLDGARWVEKNL
jgi:hypothetical protein